MNGMPPPVIQWLGGGESVELVKAVLYQDREVGKAHIRREGLYYAIRCSCKQVDTRKWRLRVSCCGKDTDLGIGIPSHDMLTWETRTAAKQVGCGELTFSLVESPASGATEFVPVVEGQPFEAIGQLEGARFAFSNGVPGVWIIKR